jgi:transposase
MTQDSKEDRRCRAWALSQKGWTQNAIAEALGVSKGAVSQWLTAARGQGSDALAARKHPGPTPRLSPEQGTQLRELLSQPATAHGFVGAVWTTRRIATLIARHFGVHYHHDHIGRLLHRLGLSVQKPRQPARQRNAEAVATWRSERWPALKKKPGANGA